MKLNGTEFYLSKKVGKAIGDYQMLSNGDRIAVGVSGGKDSLTLLRILKDRQAFCPVKYYLVAVHIDLGYQANNIKKIKKYFKKNGYEYVVKKLRLSSKDKTCFWCSWNRRKMLFETAAECNCNKVALGHHLDDIVQTILLNQFFNSEISAMSPKQELFGGRLTVIRPLAYVEERQTSRFAQEEKLPYYKDNCKNSFTSNRRWLAGIIKDLERICPNIKTNIFRSIKRIKKDYLL